MITRNLEMFMFDTFRHAKAVSCPRQIRGSGVGVEVGAEGGGKRGFPDVEVSAV